MTIEVISAFGAYSLQGPPRFGRRHYGVAPGGAFDQESSRLANALVGNFGGESALELSNCSLTLRPDCEMQISWVGAGAAQAVETLASGVARLFPAPASGCRSYLAVPGGLLAEGLGRFSVPGWRPMPPIRLKNPPRSLSTGPFRVLAGPQAPVLKLDEFLASEFAAAHEMDRTGVRLRSVGATALFHSVELPSEPSVHGAIQILPTGHPIILGPDGPTIGGYPKIAVVATVDLDRIAQIRPDDTVRFQLVDFETALEQMAVEYRRRERAIAQIKIAVESISPAQ